MAIIHMLLAFFVALIAGGFTIFVAAIYVVNVWNYSYAILTAFIGGLIWGLAAAVAHPIATVLLLIVWIVVIDMVYPGDWRHASVVAFIAWCTALLLLLMTKSLFGVDIGMLGIPGL